MRFSVSVVWPSVLTLNNHAQGPQNTQKRKEGKTFVHKKNYSSVNFYNPGWAPTWRLYTNLYYREKVSPRILHKRNCCDLSLGENLCIVTFLLFSDFELNLLNGF